MEVGELEPVRSAWPSGFPRDLPAEARAVQEAWQEQAAPDAGI
jgi:hypothetical protein